MYYIDNASYPGTSSDLTSATSRYITSIPDDPFNGSGATQQRTVGNGALAENSYGYISSSTAWLLLSNGPDTDPDVTTADFSTPIAGQLGGSEGEYSGYGSSDWYNPDNGTTSNGDLGLGGP